MMDEKYAHDMLFDIEHMARHVAGFEKLVVVALDQKTTRYQGTKTPARVCVSLPRHSAYVVGRPRLAHTKDVSELLVSCPRAWWASGL